MSSRYLTTAILLASLVSAPLAGAHECHDIFLRSSDLEAGLDEVLEGWGSLVKERKVLIEPAAPSCYLQVRIVVSALLTPDCILAACSTATAQDREVGLRPFDVHGCEALSSVWPISRHVPAVMTDVSDQIRSRCGSDDFQIVSVAPTLVGGQARLRIQLRARQRPATGSR
jgi:hypothetical protein